uniref:Uncharacterized protein n=1 Tax=Aplanochytrium stocchinoi TaxID=215587 RepID=A0A7S3UZF0_9STRA|mmetsp:Transcript_6355/g.8345  ORF Transcript_6355/g.8345 Transcript_6355/m.8345 type:complete len:345 (+) Transcript_6355:136-1170(+)
MLSLPVRVSTLCLVFTLLFLAGSGTAHASSLSFQSAYEHTDSEIAALRGKRLLNMDEVKAGVGFSNTEENPYPKHGKWYDTKINRDTKCWVVFGNAAREEYRLITSDTKPEGDSHLTHYGQCGVCSTLQDLAVYISQPDLTTPVRSCTLKLVPSWQLSCLRKKIGFSYECSQIWFFNAHHTGMVSPRGGCFGVCMANLFNPNNQPVGDFNPCEPAKDKLFMQAFEPEYERTDDINPSPTAGFCLPSGKRSAALLGNFKKKRVGYCGNTINGEPACHPQQYQNGPYRLNPCLQCDECRSGPVFQKVAGRTRRNSGLHSKIERPLMYDKIYHNYGLPIASNIELLF